MTTAKHAYDIYANPYDVMAGPYEGTTSIQFDDNYAKRILNQI